MKKHLHNSLRALFLSLAVLLSLPMLAVEVEINGINYDLDTETDQAAVIRKSSGAYSGEVVIPETVEYQGTTYSVTSIGDKAFYDCSGLTSFTIPNSVTSIGWAAFQFCSGLTSVTIGNSVTSIGGSAFWGCSRLTSVTIPNSVTSIGSQAFWYCSGLTSVHISDIASWCNIDFPDSDSNPLYYAHHLYLNGEEVKDLVIPNSVTSIGDYAFYNCSGLTSVTIGNSVTSIGSSAFSGCSGLTSVTIPNSVTSIGNGAFRDCSGLTSVTIPNSVTSIGGEAFRDCSGLTSVTIGNSVTSIGDAAFFDCDGLTSVTIPNSVTSIGNCAFQYCSRLTSVTIGNSVTSIGGSAFWGCSRMTSVTIGNSVTSIGGNAFFGCYGLTSVTIPNSVTSIAGGAFSSCSGLTSVHISDIAAWCNIDFEDSYSNPLLCAQHLYLNGEEVKDLVIPNSVTSIVERAFHYCKGLTSVTIPNSVTSIGDYAFQYCSGLTSVTIGNSVTSIGEDAFYHCSGLASVTIGNSVTSIGSGAFAYCDGLTSVTIPNSVTSIEYATFKECSGLTSVTIGNSVTSIGGSAFYYCKSLTSVTIPNSVTSIGDKAFEYCSVLTSVTIGNSVTSIGQQAFCAGRELLDVYCYAEKVPSTNSYAFDGYHLENATLHVPAGSIESYRETEPWSGFEKIVAISTEIDGINYDLDAEAKQATVIAKSSGEYSGEVIIPESVEHEDVVYSVTSIGQSAFKDCSGLTSVTIPNSVTSIGNYAFAYCPELLDVYCYAENVPSTASNTFESSPIENATLHVPVGSIESYRETEPWSRFGRNSLLPNLTLTDGEVFDNNIEQEVGTLTYTRTLPNMLWNPLYVPFKIPYEVLEENYEVAYINAMHSYDNDDNGEIDEMVMEIVKVKAGTLKPNHPYLIKAKNEEAKVMNIVQEAVTLYPAEITTLDCSSVYTKFEITGTYQKMTSGELNGSLVISTDGAWKKLSPTSILKPFRFYLTISSREGSPVEIEDEAMSRVRIRVMGEDDNATGIDEVKMANEEQKSEIYDLSGRRVSAPAKGGVYIIKGKKVIY